MNVFEIGRKVWLGGAAIRDSTWDDVNLLAH